MDQVCNSQKDHGARMDGTLYRTSKICLHTSVQLEYAILVQSSQSLGTLDTQMLEAQFCLVCCELFLKNDRSR